MFWVISVYFNIRNTLPKSGTFLLEHPVYGPGSSVGIATGYGLEGPRIESRWGRDYPHLSWGPPSLLYDGYWVFPGGKERPGRDADLSPPSGAVVKERVELYLYSPYRPYGLHRASVPLQGCALPFTFSFINCGLAKFVSSVR